LPIAFARSVRLDDVRNAFWDQCRALNHRRLGESDGWKQHMRMWLAIATLLVLLHESSFAQGLFGGFNPPASYQYFRPPSQHSAPPARPKWRAPSQQVSVPIPRPENTTIDEKYAKGSIVNHERYFVDEPGHAVRYPVAVGTPVDQWEGIQTITAKRENPRWFPSEDIQWEMGVPPMVPSRATKPARASGALSGRHFVPHSRNQRPGSIGGAVSHGCFRMHNPHIIELYKKSTNRLERLCCAMKSSGPYKINQSRVSANLIMQPDSIQRKARSQRRGLADSSVRQRDAEGTCLLAMHIRDRNNVPAAARRPWSSPTTTTDRIARD
jgi:hypothetical protein